MRPHLLKHGAIPWVDEMLSNLPQQEPKEDFMDYLTRLNKCGRELFQKLERKLTAVTEQRDRLAEELTQLKSQLTQTRGAVTISRNGYVQELEEQRDRLAKALRMITTFDYTDLQCDNGHGARSVATEALQSLKPKEQ